MPQEQLEKKRKQKQSEETSKSTKEKKEETSKKNTTRKRKERKKPHRVRIFPLWLRIIVITIVALLTLALGLMFGYGVIGEGEPLDALKFETWRHILDIVVKE